VSAATAARATPGDATIAVRAETASSVRRWLATDALRPWQHRSWISIRDPDFAAKAAPVLDL
jgi:DDE superfamily endonuclease